MHTRTYIDIILGGFKIRFYVLSLGLESTKLPWGEKCCVIITFAYEFRLKCFQLQSCSSP